ncbi:hypothetical protein C3V41_12310 [Actinomyces sp. oral taxon 897]|nr:hypothetical protein C3V41_12310 [Actinomyces sp. oral taxon 897]
MRTEPVEPVVSYSIGTRNEERAMEFQQDVRRTHYLPVGTRGVLERGQAWRGVQTGWVSYRG